LVKKLISMAIMLGLTLGLLLPQVVMASVTGKISGTVVDTETGEPLPGVAVSVVGTKLGALTDENGEYYILNVPVGTYTVKASLIGFAPVEVTNVGVSADLTAYTDYTLSKEALELGRTIVVRAERPLVIKDKTTSVDIVSREELQAMPVRTYDQVVGLQNSVVRMNSNVDFRQRGGRESLANAPEINLRGGRPSEVAYYVDGFSQQDPLSGISTANISNNAIKEVKVTSGAFSAEYGHVASGIVNVVTNSGSEEYHGNLELISDNAASIFGYDSFDQNWYTADIGGPIPGLDKAYFFLSGERRWMADRSPSINTQEIYEQFDVDQYFEESQRMPNNFLKGWSGQGKLDFELQENVKLALNGNYSHDRWQEYRHYYLNPTQIDQVEHTPLYEDENLGLNAKITHTLNAETFYNLSASYFRTERMRGDGVIFDDYEAYRRATGNPEWDDLTTAFREGDSIFAHQVDNNVVQGSEEDTVVGFYESYWGNYLHRISSYIGFKGDITSQISRAHTLKFGFDFQRHTLRYFENLDATDIGGTTGNLNRYGFDENGEESDDQGWENDTKHPINLGVYLQDRFEWRDFVVNAGLRFDFFDYKSLRLIDVEDPFDPTDVGDGEFQESDFEDSKKFTRLSPRLGVSFPVSDQTQVYMNYGKFFQRPDLRRLYVGYDFLEDRIGAGSYYPFASPNLEPEQITQYEFGLTRQLGENTAVNIAAYYKDVEDLTQIFHQAAEPYAYDYYGNVDYGTIKGVDFSLTMRRTRNMAISVKYSLSYASGTGSYANSTFNIAWKNPQGTPKSTNPLDYDQRHSLIGMFDLRSTSGEGPMIGDMHPLENMGLNVVMQLASGLPYTPTNPYDAITAASVQQEPIGSINSANMPWNYQIDMKLEKTFTFGQYRLVPYLWIKNLLNTENELAVYEGTGEANTTGYLGSDVAQGSIDNPETGEQFEYLYDFGQNNPKNYSNPRIIYLGIRMSF